MVFIGTGPAAYAWSRVTRQIECTLNANAIPFWFRNTTANRISLNSGIGVLISGNIIDVTAR